MAGSNASSGGKRGETKFHGLIDGGGWGTKKKGDDAPDNSMPEHIGIDTKDNVLTVEGHSCITLAEMYGTPLFVISENAIRHNYRKFYNAFKSRYPAEVVVCVGMKSNFGLAVRRIIALEGGGGDVFGEGELYVALLAGTDPKKIVVNGVNKPNEVLLATVQRGVHINVDSLDELERLNEIAAKLGKVAGVSLRIRLPLSELRGKALIADSRYPPPGIDMVEWETEFKFGMEPASFFEAMKQALTMKNINLKGVMYHGGLPRRARYYKEETEDFMNYVGEAKKRFNWEPEMINLGGGFSPKRFGYKELPPTPDEYAEAITSVIKEKCKEYSLSVPRLLLEPGRWCLENTTIYLARVGSIKEDSTLAKKKWVYVDGNVNHLIGGADIYMNYHYVIIANRADALVKEVADICGQLCGAGDILAKSREIPKVECGDILAFLDTGAYCESHAKQSNAVPRPASVLVNKDSVAIARERETIQDVLSHERCPFWLL